VGAVYEGVWECDIALRSRPRVVTTQNPRSGGVAGPLSLSSRQRVWIDDANEGLVLVAEESKAVDSNGE